MDKNRCFATIVALLVPLFFLLLEASLRISNYGEDLPLFVPDSRPPKESRYLKINRRVAERYFPEGHFIPRPTDDRFLKEKPADGYRVFVLGGSTVAGWPYPNNVMFPRRLEQQLADTFPDRHIEVVSVGIAAINSYTLLDFMEEVVAQRPDAILIYAGHNEFYGALGAASTISLGRTGWLVRLYLSLQDSRLFMLMRNTVNGARSWPRGRGGASPDETKSPTLMGQVIGEPQIALGNATYERGKAQLRQNLRAILSKAKKAGVPVLVSELVCNIRDQPPFFFDGVQAQSSAAEAFRDARRLESMGRMEEARAEYYRAKDLDGLRFRAPEEFNAIIRDVAGEFGVPVVPMQSYFEEASPHGLIGIDLMLEHLHPNGAGHLLMGRAFFDAMREHGFVEADWTGREVRTLDDYHQESLATEMDLALGKLRALYLIDHWPFKPVQTPTNAARGYRPRNKVEAVAKEVARGAISYEKGHLQMADHYRRQGRSDLALREYRALVYSSPLNVERYLAAAEALIAAKDHGQASAFLDQAARVDPNHPRIDILKKRLSVQ